MKKEKDFFRTWHEDGERHIHISFSLWHVVIVAGLITLAYLTFH